MTAATATQNSVAAALRADEGAVRVVYFTTKNPGHWPYINVTRRIVPVADAREAERLTAVPARYQGAQRADVEMMIDGHWSLIARRQVRGKYEEVK